MLVSAALSDSQAGGDFPQPDARILGDAQQNPGVISQEAPALHPHEVRRAQDLLENTDDTIERIATLCGFGTAHQMRTHFTRINHVTPHAYQRTFRSRAAA